MSMLVRKVVKILSVAVLGLGVMIGYGGVTPAEAKGHHKKMGFFKKFKRKVKAKVKKVRRAIVTGVCKVQNKIVDTGVRAKSRITGKKPKKVWVRGHYKKGNKHHTRGHWKRNIKHRKPAGGGAPAPAPSSYAPMPPSSAPLPPLDPALPTFKGKKGKR